MDNRDPSIADAMRMAQSPAGQQLIRLLQQTGGEKVSQAINKAASGDMSQLGVLLNALTENAEARALLQQLGGKNGQHGR